MPTPHKLIAMLLTLVALAPAAEGQDWPMLGHDPQHTNAGPLAVEPPYRITWAWYGQSTTRPGGPFPEVFEDVLSHWTQPVVATVPTEALTAETPDEEPQKALRVFVGTLAGNVYAIDAETGANVWQARVDGPVMNSLAVAGRRVFAADATGKLTAFEVASGTELWQVDLDAPLMCSPLPVEGKVFIAGRDAKAHALDAATGTELWSTALDAPAAGSCAYADGRVFLATHAATAYALSARDGELIWQRRMRGQDPWYYPVIANGAVMFRTRSAVHGPEYDGMEKVLAALPPETSVWPPKDWLLEKAAITAHLEQPDEQSFFIYDAASGETRFTPAVTRMGGHNDCPPWPVVTPTGLVLAHRRVRSSRMTGTYNFGSKYPIDFDEIDLQTRDRKPLAALPENRELPLEKRVQFFGMDNTHYATVGGHRVYFYHNSIGVFTMDLLTGEAHGVVRYGPDPTPVPAGTQYLYPRPEHATDWALSDVAPKTPRRLINISSGAVPAGGALFVNMGYAGCLVRIDGKDAPGAPPETASPASAQPASGPAPEDAPKPVAQVAIPIAVNEILTPGAVPAKMKPLQDELIRQVRLLLQTGHLAPLYFLSGENDGQWLFDSPADIVWAVGEALPFLPDDLASDAAAFMRNEMHNHPLWDEDMLPADVGQRREYFPITDANRNVRDIARLKEIKLRRLYPLWLYAWHGDQADYIRENWPAIKAFADRHLRDLTADNAAWGDLTGLVALARLAVMAEDVQTYERALAGLQQLGKDMGDVEAVRKRFPERQRLCLLPNMVRMADDKYRAGVGILLADLTPASVRLLDTASLDEHAEDIRRYLPAWFITLGGPTYGDHVFNEGCSMPPPVSAGYFLLNAYLGKVPPEQLADWVDVPVCRYGDAYYMRKLAATLTRATRTSYKRIAPPQPETTLPAAPAEPEEPVAPATP